MAPTYWNAALYTKNQALEHQYGQELLELLAPQEGETILDIGCGIGDLTAKLAESGAHVMGVDSSAAILEKARERSPHIEFMRSDILDLDMDGLCDAVFSNAVLHWIDVADQKTATDVVYRALRPGGRFVAECGGYGNCAIITSALCNALQEMGYPRSQTFYYPTIGAAASVLERAGFVVRYMTLFPSRTVLEEGDDGAENWLRIFKAEYLESLEEDVKQEVLHKAIEQLHGTWLYDKETGSWCADYVRLRFVAEKPANTATGGQVTR